MPVFKLDFVCVFPTRTHLRKKLLFAALVCMQIHVIPVMDLKCAILGSKYEIISDCVFFFSSGQYRRKFKIIYLGDLWSHVCIYKLTSFLVQIAFDNKRNRLNTCFFQQVELEGIKLKTAN